MKIFTSSKNDELIDRCRCCMDPSVEFIQVESRTKTGEGTEKTFKELLYEITNINIPDFYEYFMPQQLCHKCGQQLKITYKFIQQTQQVVQHYLEIAYKQQTIPEDLKNIDHLQETPIDVKENVYEDRTQYDINKEPVIIEESSTDIKPNVEDNQTITVKEEIEEDRDLTKFCNTATNFTDDEEYEENDDSQVREGIDDFLPNELLARRCDICHKIYRNERFLKIHKRYAHVPDEDKIPCPLCSYKANRSWTLRIHMGLVHGQDKVGKYFKPLRKGKKAYPCSICSRSYAHKETLRTHIKVKHLNKPLAAIEQYTKKTKEKNLFLCTYCGQSFNTKRGVESHNLTHSDNRPFFCEICNKSFKRVKDLKLHLLIHSDEKPHQCSECSKAFKRVDKLKLHMKVHSELRPYKCNECEKTFKYHSVLKTHMHIHTG